MRFLKTSVIVWGLTLLFAALQFAIISAFTDADSAGQSFGQAAGVLVYVLIMLSIDFIVPVLIAVYVFDIIRKKIEGYLKITALMLFFIHASFFIWAFFDLLIYYAGSIDFNEKGLIEHYLSEFKAYLSVGTFTALIIHPVDKRVRSRENEYST